MAESKQIVIDGVSGTWTPNDDGWEYLGKITEFEPGYEYEVRNGVVWTSSLIASQKLPPAKTREYRRRPDQVWQGAGFYIVQGCTDPIPVIKRDRRTLPYISGNHTFANLEIVQLVRKFTDEEVRSIVDNSVWPEEV